MATSASAALAAGAAALLAANPPWTLDEVVAALRTSATVIPTLPTRLNLVSLIP